MTRAKWNAVVDTAALLGFAALVSTGLLMRYQLPPGSGGGHAHESSEAHHAADSEAPRGRAAGGPGGQGSAAEHAPAGKAASPALTVWGLTRHEWGAWHFDIAVGLLAILAVHLVLHARWILGMVRGKASDASGRRLAVGVIALLAALAAVSAPLLSSVVERAP